MKNKIISILNEHENQIVSGGKIASLLNISRNGVNKHIKALKHEGYLITSIPNKGYIFSSNGKLSEEIIKAYLNIPLELIILNSVDSTNNYGKALAMEARLNALVVANAQTAGRGRLMRSFYSPGDSGIYMSLVLDPKIVIKPNLITPIAAVSVFRAIKLCLGIETKIKWVNDLYYAGKKICGILTEASMDFETNTLSYIVLGIGINLTTDVFPPELSHAGSLNVGAVINRNMLVAHIVNEIYSILNNTPHDDFMSVYREKSNVIGKRITVMKADSRKDALALSIDCSGGLNVKYDDNTTETLHYGEVSIMGDFYD